MEGHSVNQELPNVSGGEGLTEKRKKSLLASARRAWTDRAGAASRSVNEGCDSTVRSSRKV